MHLTVVTSFGVQQQNLSPVKEKKMGSKPARWVPAACLGWEHTDDASGTQMPVLPQSLGQDLHASGAVPLLPTPLPVP